MESKNVNQNGPLDQDNKQSLSRVVNTCGMAPHWPLDTFILVFYYLKKLTGAASSMEFINVISALEGTVHDAAAQYLKDKFLLIDLTQCQSKEELCLVSRTAKTLLSKSNCILADTGSKLENALKDSLDKNVVFITDNNVQIAHLQGNLNKCTDIIFCCDSPGSLATNKISDIIIEISRAAHQANIEPRHLIIDYRRNSLYFQNTKIMGLLDYNLLEKLYELPDPIVISIPHVNQLKMPSNSFEALINTIISKNDTYNYRGSNTQSSTAGDAGDFLRKSLKGLRFYLPSLENFQFVTSGSKDTCNTINLSLKRLEEVRSRKIDMQIIFEIHSLVNWDLPRIKVHSGHLLMFTRDFQNPVTQLVENLKRLHDLNPDGRKVELLPRGVTRSRLINWIPNELSRSVFGNYEYTAPKLQLFSDTMKSLEVRPLVTQEYSTLVINRLEFPILEELTILSDQMILGDYQSETIYRKIDEFPSQVKSQNSHVLLAAGDMMKWCKIELLNLSGLNLINPIFFSPSNNLKNCKKIEILTAAERRTNYLFSIENLKQSLPKLSLNDNFPTFRDEGQKVIFV